MRKLYQLQKKGVEILSQTSIINGHVSLFCWLTRQLHCELVKLVTLDQAHSTSTRSQPTRDLVLCSLSSVLFKERLCCFVFLLEFHLINRKLPLPQYCSLFDCSYRLMIYHLFGSYKGDLEQKKIEHHHKNTNSKKNIKEKERKALSQPKY